MQTHELFAPYPVTSSEILEAADRSSREAGVLEDLENDVRAQHQTTVDAVQGDIREPVQSAGEQSGAQSRQVRQTVTFASGALRMFAFAVDDYNVNSGPAYNTDGSRANPRSIDKINTFYNELMGRDFGLTYEDYEEGGSREEHNWAEDWVAASNEVKARLRTEEEWLVTNLDDEANEIRRLLERGPNEADVRAMYAAGALPSVAVTVFPGYDLAGVQFTRIPPDLLGKSPEELETYLRDHPNTRDYVEALVRQGDLSDEELAIVEAQARVDAQVVRDAVESGEATQETLDRIEEGQQFLTLVNELTAENEELSEASHAYTFAWTNAMGSNALSKLPQVVSDAAYAGQNGPGGMVSPGDVNHYLTPVGDAILNLSNGVYQRTGDEYAFDLDGDGSLDVSDMPQAVQDLMSMRIGEYSQYGYRTGSFDEDGLVSVDTVENLDAFNGWADLLASSTVDPGRGFAVDLAEQAIEAKQDMNAILAKARTDTASGALTAEEFDELQQRLSDLPASDLLQVVARNENASADLLLDETHRQELLGMNWTVGDGAAEVIVAGTDRDPGDGGGTALQAEAALRVMTEIAKDPTEYLERTTNETVSDAILDVGITWVDAFGNNISSDTGSGFHTDDRDVLNRTLPLSVSLSEDDQSGFLQFMSGSGNADAVRFEAASQAYGQQLIAAALEQDDPVLVDHALDWAGRAEGQIQQANLEWAMDQLDIEHDEEAARIEASNRSRAAANTAAQMTLLIAGTTAGSVYPVTAPFIAVGGGAATPFVEGLLGEEEAPDYEAMEADEFSRRLEELELDSTHRRNYLLAQTAILAEHDAVDDPEYAQLFNDDGTLKTLEEISNLQGSGNGLDDLDALAQAPTRDWEDEHGKDIDLDAFDDARDETFPPVDDGEEPTEENEGDETNDGRTNEDGWRDDGVAERRLYGDNVPEDYAEAAEDGPMEPWPDDNDQITQNPAEE